MAEDDARLVALAENLRAHLGAIAETQAVLVQRFEQLVARLERLGGRFTRLAEQLERSSGRGAPDG